VTRAATSLAFLLVAVVSGLVGLVMGGGGVVRTVPAPPPAPASPWPSFSEIVERVNPAVVHIAVADAGERATEMGHGWSPRSGEGSGFVIEPDGYILTNHHVVAGARRIRVRFADKKDRPARLVGADSNTDLALLKVEAAGLPSIPLGDSDQIRVGDWVCAIGNPYRFDHSVTVGVVSSKGRKIWDASFDSYIQTDAAINPGNSGGPLLNAAGSVVGINSAMIAQGQGIGFAVPVNVAREVVEQLRRRGRVARGYLGVQLQEMEPDLQKLVGMADGRGAVVLDVLKGGPGEAAGLRRYDVITAVSGRGIENGDELVRQIASRSPGSAVVLTVFREGHVIELGARLEERATAEDRGRQPPASAREERRAGDALGLDVLALGRDKRAEHGIPADRAGVVIKQVLAPLPGSDALEHGDMILEINRRPTPDLPSYERAVSALRPGDVAWLLVYRPHPSGTFLARLDVEP
jgi:serine protease Do